MLNAEQRAAVRHIDGPLLVLAGAGSGKTRVITHKINYLLRECRLAPGAVAAVTFTNKAAREMAERVAAAPAAKRGAQKPMISTFHSLGLRFLQRESEQAGIRKGFSIFDAEDTRGLLRELAHRELGLADKELAAVQARISDWKSGLIEPAQALSAAPDDIAVRDARLFEVYERHLRAYNAVDFDDLIALPVRCLRQDPAVRERWQNRFRYLLVDEYQDTNAAQYELLRLLAGPRACFTVVGDDDQSIYAWRGARPENLRQLQADYPHLAVIKLEQNYRSTVAILSAANGLISHNPHLFEKRLWSELGRGEPIRVLGCEDAEAEVRRVVAELLQHRLQRRTRYGAYAILYRGNHQARPFEKALREHRIPYRITGGPSFFDAAEVKDVLAYLRLLTNPDDDAAFLRIINVPRREIGAATLERLGGYAARRQISLLSACGEIGLDAVMPERPRARLQAFADWMAELARFAETEPPADCLRRLLNESDYLPWLAEATADRRRLERRHKNVEELIGWITRLADRQPAGDGGLSALLAHISLMGMLERRTDEDSVDQVQLMTLHSAKGLEFDHVFIVGFEEGLLPHRNSIDADTIEEERRLAYVGITRARRSLTITHAARRKAGGEWTDCEPSRFLQELPAETLDWQRPSAEQDPAKRRANGRTHLAGLRQLLNEP